MSPELRDALANLLIAALSLGATALTLVGWRVAQFIEAKKALAKQELGATQYALLVDAIKLGVQEAEQLGATTGLKDKMGLVLDRGLAFANAHGIDITASEIKGIAEALLNQGVQAPINQIFSGLKAEPLAAK